MSQTINDILNGENINTEEPHHSDKHPYQEHFNDRTQLIRERKCHYFVIGGGVWVTDPDLAKALKKHKVHSASIGIARVWFVPLELESAEYLIDTDAGSPKVYGRELIAEIPYKNKR